MSLIFLRNLATKKFTKSEIYCVLQKGEIEVKNTRKREKYTKNAKMTKLLIQQKRNCFIFRNWKMENPVTPILARQLKLTKRPNKKGEISNFNDVTGSKLKNSPFLSGQNSKIPPFIGSKLKNYPFLSGQN